MKEDGAYVTYTPLGGADAVSKKLGSGVDTLHIPQLFASHGNNGAQVYTGTTEWERGGTMIENHWKYLSFERFGSSVSDGIGYPASTVTSGTIRVVGFTEEGGTGVVISTGFSAENIEVSDYKYLRFTAKNPQGSGASGHFVNIVLSNSKQ